MSARMWSSDESVLSPRAHFVVRLAGEESDGTLMQGLRVQLIAFGCGKIARRPLRDRRHDGERILCFAFGLILQCAREEPFVPGFRSGFCINNDVIVRL